MTRVLALLAAALLLAGCSESPAAEQPTPSSTAPDPAAVVRTLLLPDEVTAPHGLVETGEPVEGVQPLVACPELASAGQTAAGITATWTWSDATSQVVVTQYSAVYRGISGKDVVKQTRAAAGCHRSPDAVPSPLDVDEYFYIQDDQGPTKPFVDDRFAYCVMNYPRHHSTCTAVQAKGDKVIRTSFEKTGQVTADTAPSVRMFAQAVTDRLVA